MLKMFRAAQDQKIEDLVEEVNDWIETGCYKMIGFEPFICPFYDPFTQRQGMSLIFFVTYEKGLDLGGSNAPVPFKKSK